MQKAISGTWKERDVCQLHERLACLTNCFCSVIPAPWQTSVPAGLSCSNAPSWPLMSDGAPIKIARPMTPKPTRFCLQFFWGFFLLVQWDGQMPCRGKRTPFPPWRIRLISLPTNVRWKSFNPVVKSIIISILWFLYDWACELKCRPCFL